MLKHGLNFLLEHDRAHHYPRRNRIFVTSRFPLTAVHISGERPVKSLVSRSEALSFHKEVKISAFLKKAVACSPVNPSGSIASPSQSRPSSRYIFESSNRADIWVSYRPSRLIATDFPRAVVLTLT